MKTSARLFWWNPRRMPRTLNQEVRERGRAWLAASLKGRSPFSNFGDELSPMALEYLTGRRVRWAHPREADFLGVGSILDFYALAGGRGATVMGSGLRSAEFGDLVKGAIGEIAAVRGPRTAETLSAGPDVGYGDPALVVPRIVGEQSRGTRPLVLPHFSVFGSREGRAWIRALQNSGYEVVSPASPPRAVCVAIGRASWVVSNSLHGLIVAHALGVPAIPVMSTNTSESLFKYEDHFSAIGISFEPVSPDTIVEGVRTATLEFYEGQAEVARLRSSELADGLEARIRGSFR